MADDFTQNKQGDELDLTDWVDVDFADLGERRDYELRNICFDAAYMVNVDEFQAFLEHNLIDLPEEFRKKAADILKRLETIGEYASTRESEEVYQNNPDVREASEKVFQRMKKQQGKLLENTESLMKEAGEWLRVNGASRDAETAGAVSELYDYTVKAHMMHQRGIIDPETNVVTRPMEGRYLDGIVSSMQDALNGFADRKGTTKIGLNTKESGAMFKALNTLQKTLKSGVNAQNVDTVLAQLAELNRASETYLNAKMDGLKEKNKTAPETETGRARMRLSRDLVMFTYTMMEQMDEIKEKNHWGVPEKHTEAKKAEEQEQKRIRENRPEVQKIDFTVMEKAEKAAVKKPADRKKADKQKAVPDQERKAQERAEAQPAGKRK